MKNSQRGSLLFKIIIVGAIAGGLHYYKDASGESYLQKAYKIVHHYTVGRNEAAMNDAKGVRNTMQERQDEIKAQLNGQ